MLKCHPIKSAASLAAHFKHQNLASKDLQDPSGVGLYRQQNLEGLFNWDFMKTTKNWLRIYPFFFEVTHNCLPPWLPGISVQFFLREELVKLLVSPDSSAQLRSLIFIYSSSIFDFLWEWLMIFISVETGHFPHRKF